jgi:sialate O-acetylesterase
MLKAENQEKLTLPRLISDGMVLQRNAKVKIWGKAPVGCTIDIYFLERLHRCTASIDGKWSVYIDTGNAGGPYDMKVTDNCGNEIVVRDILLGDVWFCSGQSNMQIPMLFMRERYPNDVAGADNDFIRHFSVPIRSNFKNPEEDYESGSWISAKSDVLGFTAVGYYFALKIYKKYQIPIGLINASMGGTAAETWMSAEALEDFPEFLSRAINLKDDDHVAEIKKRNQETHDEWYAYINANDAGLPAGGKPCYDIDYDASSWPFVKVPCIWEEEGLGSFNGVVWFRKEIELLPGLLGKPASIYMGHVRDNDMVYINGTLVGSMEGQWGPRIYNIPDGLLKEGRNIITARVISESGKGGFYKGKPYHLKIGSHIIDLYGKWQYLVGVRTQPMTPPVFIDWEPMGLYNGMVAPAINYVIKGVLWYQGETNTHRPESYKRVMQSLITDWRKKWGVGDFPFLYVQLPNFEELNDDRWPELRQKQLETLDVPNTGMAVTIDIGEWNDIHPDNKRDVGYRLALLAQKLAYSDESEVSSGPIYESMRIDGNKIFLSFTDTGSGLATRDGCKPRCFEVCGSDGVYVQADAWLDENMVVVSSDLVDEPLHVRYAWSGNPEGANLCNREGLPASPFTTKTM